MEVPPTQHVLHLAIQHSLIVDIVLVALYERRESLVDTHQMFVVIWLLHLPHAAEIYHGRVFWYVRGVIDVPFADEVGNEVRVIFKYYVVSRALLSD